MAKRKSKHQRKFGTVMREFYADKLRSSSGHDVTDPQQAKAIAHSEARKAQERKRFRRRTFRGRRRLRPPLKRR